VVGTFIVPTPTSTIEAINSKRYLKRRITSAYIYLLVLTENLRYVLSLLWFVHPPPCNSVRLHLDFP
jgi:hypothetical protein